MKSKNIVFGIFAHVDAGKTTMSEAILHVSGVKKEFGRVDHKNSFFDTNQMERKRGITIFSKQASFSMGNKNYIMIDTPGHVDFSAEMERCVQILDYGIIVISGADGIQSHTVTLWKLFRHYNIPIFFFVNKMDHPKADKEQILQNLRNKFSRSVVEFSNIVEDSKEYVFSKNNICEELSMADDEILEEFLEKDKISFSLLTKKIAKCKIFPVLFGSALKLQGIDTFLEIMNSFMEYKSYSEMFSGRVFKITRDEQGNRLTHIKITGGILKVKDTIGNSSDSWKEKVDQIRLYNGEKYVLLKQADAGTVCTVTGIESSLAGEGLGNEEKDIKPVVEPVLRYKIMLPASMDYFKFYKDLLILSEEYPELQPEWEEETSEINVKIMGEMEIEILKTVIAERLNVPVEFGNGTVLYKETIKKSAIGVGHFEPLKHYAEVHLLLEMGERGSGLVFDSQCSNDVLSQNWQRLVLSHLKEKKHKGVLTGSEITDMKITLIAGKAHLKHTEGGDFREATYRAVRNGLKKAESVLLEPIYDFVLEIPTEYTGKAISHIQTMGGAFNEPEQNGEFSIISGYGPAAEFGSYHRQVMNYTKGLGKLILTPAGHRECVDYENKIKEIGYDSERDIANPTGSVFCLNGTGDYVPWYEVENYMHVDSGLSTDKEDKTGEVGTIRRSGITIDEEEIQAIFKRTFNANRKETKNKYQKKSPKILSSDMPENDYTKVKMKNHSENNTEKYLLVDGYNIIFAWEELKELSKIDIGSARMELADLMCKYQSVYDTNLILVFDGYKVKYNTGNCEKYDNIYIVYTKEGETADQYIEKTVHQIGQKYHVTVATGDNLEQQVSRGDGAYILSPSEFKSKIEKTLELFREKYKENQRLERNYPIIKERFHDLMN